MPSKSKHQQQQSQLQCMSRNDSDDDDNDDRRERKSENEIWKWKLTRKKNTSEEWKSPWNISMAKLISVKWFWGMWSRSLWTCYMGDDVCKQRSHNSFSLALSISFSFVAFVSFYFQYHKINIFEFYSPFFSSSTYSSVSYMRARARGHAHPLNAVRVCVCVRFPYTAYECVGLIWLQVLCVAYMPFTHIIGIREFWCEPPCSHISLSFLVLLLISLYFSVVFLVLRFVSLLLWKRWWRRRSRSHSHKYY